MLSRRSFQCHQTECDSQSKHQLCIRFWTIGNKASRIELRCPTSIQVCDRHRKRAEAYVVEPQNKEAIGMGLLKEGIPPPDFSSLEVHWVPIVNGRPVEEFAA